MGWKQQKKIWAEYPYLVDDAFHMSMKQAMERQTAEGYPAFEEMVKAAKARSDLPASAWLPVDRVIGRFTHLLFMFCAGRQGVCRLYCKNGYAANGQWHSLYAYRARNLFRR